MSRPASAAADGCRAWPLPLDGSCAGVARRLFREAVADPVVGMMIRTLVNMLVWNLVALLVVFVIY